MIAVRYCHLSTVLYLVGHGANVHLAKKISMRRSRKAVSGLLNFHSCHMLPVFYSELTCAVIFGDPEGGYGSDGGCPGWSRGHRELFG